MALHRPVGFVELARRSIRSALGYQSLPYRAAARTLDLGSILLSEGPSTLIALERLRASAQRSGPSVAVKFRCLKHPISLRPGSRDVDTLVSNVTIVSKALGGERGAARIMVSDAHTVSSMSKPWIDAVKRSGRFSHIRWDSEVEIDVTTLDSAIAEFGELSFIKIDVEGYEAEVLAGLSRPVVALSLEFTPEHLESIQKSIAKLNELGRYEYNVSLGESMRLEHDSWCSADQLLCRLVIFDHTAFGDVYARHIST